LTRFINAKGATMRTQKLVNSMMSFEGPPTLFMASAKNDANDAKDAKDAQSDKTALISSRAESSNLEISEVGASQGVKLGSVRYVLVVSLVLAAIAGVVIWNIFAR
jgi:hypothetical protein